MAAATTHLAPRQRALLRDHAAVDIDLVPEDHKGEVVGVPRPRLYKELVAPRVEVVEGFGLDDVKDEDARVGAPVDGEGKEGSVV